VRLGEIGRRDCLRIQALEQSSCSQRPRFRQELSKFGAQACKVTIFGGPWTQHDPPRFSHWLSLSLLLHLSVCSVLLSVFFQWQLVLSPVVSLIVLVVSDNSFIVMGEGHNAAGWGIGRSVIAADCGIQSPFVQTVGAATCAAPPSVIAGQYATSNCKKL